MASPAKINIGLRVVGRRLSGHHELQSLFWPIDLVDEIEIKQGSGIVCRWGPEAPWPNRSLPNASENLVSRALAQYGLSDRLKVTLTKNIPTGAGLGGGSSNAATVLRVLEKPPSTKLGADIPFFFSPQPTWVEGIGEKCTPLISHPQLLENLKFGLVIPEEPLSTKAVFTQFRKGGTPFARPVSIDTHKILTLESLTEHLKKTANDLEAAACQLYPPLYDILYKLRELPSLWAGMTGSGSTCFGIFDKPSQNTIQDFLESFRNTNCKVILASSFAESVRDGSTWMRKIETLQGVQHGNIGSESVPGQRGTT